MIITGAVAAVLLAGTPATAAPAGTAIKVAGEVAGRSWRRRLR